MKDESEINKLQQALDKEKSDFSKFTEKMAEVETKLKAEKENLRKDLEKEKEDNNALELIGFESDSKIQKLTEEAKTSDEEKLGLKVEIKKLQKDLEMERAKLEGHSELKFRKNPIFAGQKCIF